MGGQYRDNINFYVNLQHEGVGISHIINFFAAINRQQ